ncbi:hypothetical protein CK203_053767 [Vitis vinifera]|uniref:DUF4218 domain-containing protein n=1 Tax=Vitis vinifera TaxID=29760 RepID=A0A438GQQ2_VITVI|nr:hypothetical protein CK203_053767 [Vitis vinifera]
MLLVNNELSLSMYEAKKTLNALGMEYEKIQACPNDCILYRNELKRASSCPTCGASRWKVNRTGTKKSKGVPAKVVWYFPPIPRFKRMFQSSKIAKDLTWHAQERKFNEKMRHPSNSPSWKVIDHQWPDFGAEPRNLRLAISTDDVYLAPLIEDVKLLWEVGIESFDAYQREFFTLKVVLLWTINDFPAYGNLSGCTIKGYFACLICGEETDSHRLEHGKKNSFTGHRQFLPCNHPFRKQKKAFNGEQDFRSPPQALSGEEILHKIDNISNSWGNKKVRHDKSKGNTTSYWNKKSIFFDLGYWRYLHVRHNLDVMHIEKNVCETIIGTLLNIQGKTKDGLNSRLDLMDMGLRFELAPRFEQKRTYLPPACYTLSRMEKKIFCQTLAELKVPEGKVVDVSSLDELQNELVLTLCLLEKYFIPSFFDIMIHLTVHLVREVRLCGPVYLRWMYPFERFMKVLKSYVRNRNHPEGCIVECYIAEESIEFCTEYLSNVDAIGIPIGLNIDQTVGTPIPRVFKCDWVDNNNDIKVDDLGFTLVDLTKVAHKSDSFILASQAKQVFYVQDQLESRWSVVLSTPQKDLLDKKGVDDLIDSIIEHHPSISALPQVESFDAMDDSCAICI